MIHIRDPIHGTIPLTAQEVRLVDSPFFQRLRNVKQLGFADLAFPGATHSRYAHSLGAMHVATQLFDVLFPERPDATDTRRPASVLPVQLPPADRARFRQAVRMAMLFHDCGHAPLSHTTEMIMPAVGALEIPRPCADPDRRATHEDYTLKILLDSELSRTLTQRFSDVGITPEDVADLIEPIPGDPARRWTVDGMDFGPLLHQLCSSELDADRMDYLQRDSFFSGVNYGKFDSEWLIRNVLPVSVGPAVHLGVHARAIFSFEDFLLSRYHMFLSVYYHHTPVCFGEMLARYFEETPGEYALPADVEQYVQHDDAVLWMALRGSRNRWAQRICARRGLRVLRDDPRGGEGVDGTLVATLKEAGIEAIAHTSRGVLSKYFHRASEPGTRQVPAIYVVDGTASPVPVEEFTPLYRRYADAVQVQRLYVDPEHAERAQQILATFTTL